MKSLCWMVDRYERVQWTPVGEDTHVYARSLCTYDWIIRLDDDEILSEECEATFRNFVVEKPGFDVLMVPLHHLLLGRYCGTEHKPYFYKKDAVTYTSKVHAHRQVSGNPHYLSRDDPACIMHLSCSDIFTFIEKANRYTSNADRAHPGSDFTGDYYDAVKTLFGIYNSLDALKRWELTQVNGSELFQGIVKEVLSG